MRSGIWVHRNYAVPSSVRWSCLTRPAMLILYDCWQNFKSNCAYFCSIWVHLLTPALSLKQASTVTGCIFFRCSTFCNLSSLFHPAPPVAQPICRNNAATASLVTLTVLTASPVYCYGNVDHRPFLPSPSPPIHLTLPIPSCTLQYRQMHILFSSLCSCPPPFDSLPILSFPSLAASLPPWSTEKVLYSGAPIASENVLSRWRSNDERLKNIS